MKEVWETCTTVSALVCRHFVSTVSASVSFIFVHHREMTTGRLYLADASRTMYQSAHGVLYLTLFCFKKPKGLRVVLMARRRMA